jgi:hypothetical protein
MAQNMTRTSWQTLYETAVLETDPIQLSKKVDLAIAAMHQRVDELPLNGASGDEKRAIVDALRNLQRILENNNASGSSTRSGAA